MRLTLSLLAAVGLHGALFGVAAALLSHAPAEAALPLAVDVDVAVIAPRPDPIADSATASPARALNPTPAPSRAHVARRVREVALVDDSKLASSAVEGPPAAETPALPAAAPPPPPTPASAVHTGQGAGVVVSAQPRYHSNPNPDYPIPSLRRREEGIVLLDVQVQPDGTPSAISLNRSCGHPLLDRAALAAVRRWTFEPARAAGVPVSSLVVIPVRFSLEDR